jgi:hypothetical protein
VFEVNGHMIVISRTNSFSINEIIKLLV